jgi:hypothetical protein
LFRFANGSPVSRSTLFALAAVGTLLRKVAAAIGVERRERAEAH